MAFIVFLLVKFMNRLLIKRDDKEEEVIKVESDEVKLLREIRDLLKDE